MQACYLFTSLPIISIIIARKRNLVQGNVFTLVCHSVHRGRWVYPTPPLDRPLSSLDADHPPPDADPLFPLDADPPPWMQIPSGCRPPHTVNKRAARFLLECTLVRFCQHLSLFTMHDNIILEQANWLVL